MATDQSSEQDWLREFQKQVSSEEQQEHVEDLVDHFIEKRKKLPDVDEVFKPSDTEDKDENIVLEENRLKVSTSFRDHILEFGGMCVGVLLCIFSIQFLELHFLVTLLFIMISGIFLFQMMSILKKNLGYYVISNLGIEFVSLLGSDFIGWSDVEEVQLRYFKTMRNSMKNWFTLTLRSGGAKITLDSTVPKFELIIASVAIIIRQNALQIDDITNANFSAMGHLFSHMYFSEQELKDYKIVQGEEKEISKGKIYHHAIEKEKEKTLLNDDEKNKQNLEKQQPVDNTQNKTDVTLDQGDPSTNIMNKINRLRNDKTHDNKKEPSLNEKL